jgi:hypothetical protein
MREAAVLCALVVWLCLCLGLSQHSEDDCTWASALDHANARTADWGARKSEEEEQDEDEDDEE